MYNTIITGCGRSGTSMVAGSIASCYKNLGGTPHQPNEENPKGFFETNLINRINDSIISNSPGHIYPFQQFQGWLTLLDPNATLGLKNFIQKEMALITQETPFSFKDPRFCYTLEAWRHLLSNTKYICVFRHPIETISSLIGHAQRAPYLKGLVLTEEYCNKLWNTMYKWILQRQSKHGEWLFIHRNQAMIKEGLEKIDKFLEIETDKTFPDQALIRYKKENINKNLSEETYIIYEELCKRAEYLEVLK